MSEWSIYIIHASSSKSHLTYIFTKPSSTQHKSYYWFNDFLDAVEAIQILILYYSTYSSLELEIGSTYIFSDHVIEWNRHGYFMRWNFWLGHWHLTFFFLLCIYFNFIYFNSFYNPWYYAHFCGQGSNHMYWLGQAKAKPKRTTKLHVSIINKPNNTLCYSIISVFHIYWPQLSLAWDFSKGDWFKILIYD